MCEGGGVNLTQPRIRPLLYVVVSQPHAFLSCQPLKQKLDISCFNFILRSVPKGFSVKGKEYMLICWFIDNCIVFCSDYDMAG